MIKCYPSTFRACFTFHPNVPSAIEVFLICNWSFYITYRMLWIHRSIITIIQQCIPQNMFMFSIWGKVLFSILQFDIFNNMLERFLWHILRLFQFLNNCCTKVTEIYSYLDIAVVRIKPQKEIQDTQVCGVSCIS